jgi:hypothetical protein
VTDYVTPGDLLDASAEVSEAVQLHLPKFDFKIRWVSNFDELFRGGDVEETTVDALVDSALRHGRVLLQARGGAGKTSILRQLQKGSKAGGTFAVLIDLHRWRPDLFTSFNELEDNEPARMQLLLDTLAEPSGVTEEATRLLSSNVNRIFMVDGLNEVPSQIGDSLIRTLDSFARRNPLAGVIATDRLVRRPLNDPHWRLVTIAPLDGDDGLGGTAFFRNIALSEMSETTSTATYRAYLANHASLSSQELRRLSEAALSLYEETEARTFLFADLERMIGQDESKKVVDAGVVIREGDSASFSHHLFHDYLASSALVSDEARWIDRLFDTVTLRASSFDSLAMALEQISEPERADLLIRRIYDWNFYGAAYALATCRGANSAAVTESMEIALLAMLAERRWDPLRATAQQVTDALALFPSPMAGSLLEAKNLDDVFAFVEQAIDTSSDLREWIELFTTPVGATLTDDQIALIGQRDSLIGWTVANVVKRSALSAKQLTDLRQEMNGAEDPTVRWRIVHALGGHPTLENVFGLFGMLDDEYHWVRYGSIRSLVEIAGKSEELRGSVIDQLRNELEQRRADLSIVRQIERSVLLRLPPAGWAEAAGPLVEDLWAASETQEGQDHWRNVAFDLRQAQNEADSRVA